MSVPVEQLRPVCSSALGADQLDDSLATAYLSVDALYDG